MRVGLLFGTFDGVHEGHRAMLTEAKQHADKLIVSLALDEVVNELKGKHPLHTWVDRSGQLIESGLVDEVVKGDREMGMYTSISSVAPNVILVGYDQIALVKDLRRFIATCSLAIPIVILKPFKPDQFKSSLLNSV